MDKLGPPKYGKERDNRALEQKQSNAIFYTSQENVPIER